MITDHRYDCGPSEETGGPCIADVLRDNVVEDFDGTNRSCGRPRDEHAYTEYDTLVSRYEEPPACVEPDEMPTAGSMHEPPEYRGELDWWPSLQDRDRLL